MTGYLNHLPGRIGKSIAFLLRDATLHRQSGVKDDGLGNRIPVFADTPALGMIDAFEVDRANAYQIPRDDVKIIITQDSISPHDISLDDEISIGGQRFRLIAVEEDAALVAFVCQGRRK